MIDLGTGVKPVRAGLFPTAISGRQIEAARVVASHPQSMLGQPPAGFALQRTGGYPCN